jgi:elongation factor P--(R)-beta-lysine ligase
MNADLARLARLKDNLASRAQIFQLTRAFFCAHGFLEVETPVRMPAVAPEANITPFTSEGWYLATSPELHMKRMLAAGYPRLFQLSHCFRRGERGRLHNPEFTLLEWYRAGADYLDMVEDTERLVAAVARGMGLGLSITYQGQAIDLTPPWPHLTVREAFTRYAGWDPLARFDPRRFDEDAAVRVLPSLPRERPIVLMDYPREAASLARLAPGQPQAAERAEIFIGGLELTNGYSELNDAGEQRQRFLDEAAHIEQASGRRPPQPESFLAAVGQMPPAGGIALGMDRLVMLLLDAASIDEVLAFSADTA